MFLYSTDVSCLNGCNLPPIAMQWPRHHDNLLGCHEMSICYDMHVFVRELKKKRNPAMTSIQWAAIELFAACKNWEDALLKEKTVV